MCLTFQPSFFTFFNCIASLLNHHPSLCSLNTKIFTEDYFALTWSPFSSLITLTLSLTFLTCSFICFFGSSFFLSPFFCALAITHSWEHLFVFKKDFGFLPSSEFSLYHFFFKRVLHSLILSKAKRAFISLIILLTYLFLLVWR